MHSVALTGPSKLSKGDFSAFKSHVKKSVSVISQVTDLSIIYKANVNLRPDICTQSL